MCCHCGFPRKERRQSAAAPVSPEFGDVYHSRGGGLEQARFVFIAGNEPICGRLNQDKLALLYGADQARAASAVLLPLPGVGMLSVGSSDANRFFPGMGTLFLRLMSEALVTALGRYTHD